MISVIAVAPSQRSSLAQSRWTRFSEDFGLMRVLQFDDRFFIADSPYLLKASEADFD